MKLEDLSLANEARQTEWDPHNKFTALYFAVELAGEVGELCNIIKKVERERLGAPGSRVSLAAAAEELADVVIVADLLAKALDIDLSAAIIRKFNEVSEKRGFQTRL